MSFNREWLFETVGMSLTNWTVPGILKPLFALRGATYFVHSNIGSEFIATDFQAWLRDSGSATQYIDPGYPWQNGFQKRFHGTVRGELLNCKVFVSMAEAQTRLKAHRRWCDEDHPHSSLKHPPPSKFAERWQQYYFLQNREAFEPPE